MGHLEHYQVNWCLLLARTYKARVLPHATGGWSCIRHFVLERDAKALGMELPIMEFGDSGGSLVAVELLGTGRGTQVYK